ncbi:MAG: PDDEXK-like family protein [Burkholderiales bacterium]
MSLEQLLKDVDTEIKATNKAIAMFQESHAPLFRTIDFIRINENKLSEIFAFLMTPEKSHGQGTKYLRKFLQMACELNSNFPEIFLDEESKVDVKLEVQTIGQRRADLVVNIGNYELLFENKPWASDGEGQLRRYAQYIENKKAVILYLSQDEPSPESIDKDELQNLKENHKFFRINFSEISSWITSCIQETRPEKVRAFLLEVNEFIGSQLMGAPEKLNREIFHLMNQHIASSFEIFRNFNHFKREKLRVFLEDLEHEFQEKGLLLDYEWADKEKKYNKANLLNFERYASFYCYRRDTIYQQKRLGYAVKFSFEGSDLVDLIWGISRLDDKFVFEQDVAKTIFDEMNASFPNIGRCDNKLTWWPWYSAASKIRIPDNWNTEPNAWERIGLPYEDSSSIVRIIVGNAERAIQVLEEKIQA